MPESRSLLQDVPQEVRDLLARAADALHDAAWALGNPAPSPPLPDPVMLVLSQTKRVEQQIREALRA